MNSNSIAPITKLSVARSQLLTAMDLFVRDKDPISVHSLACGGGELIEGLAEAQGEQIFATHILETHPDLDRGRIRQLRNVFWNAFKHFNRHDGQSREDQELLQQFDDAKNDAALFIGWWDYLSLMKKLPVAVQVFQVWYYAIYEEKVAPGENLDAIRRAFPDIRRQTRAEQKRRLRRRIETYRKDAKLLADPRTEVND